MSLQSWLHCCGLIWFCVSAQSEYELSASQTHWQSRTDTDCLHRPALLPLVCGSAVYGGFHRLEVWPFQLFIFKILVTLTVIGQNDAWSVACSFILCSINSKQFRIELKGTGNLKVMLCLCYWYANNFGSLLLIFEDIIRKRNNRSRKLKVNHTFMVWQGRVWQFYFLWMD